LLFTLEKQNKAHAQGMLVTKEQSSTSIILKEL